MINAKITRTAAFGLAACLLLTFSFGVFAQKEAPPAGGQPKPFVFPKEEVYTLPNGMRVVLVPYGSVPKVAIQAHIRNGILVEKPEQRWISDAVANLLKEGTATRTAENIARQSAEMGGSIFSFAATDKTTIGGEVLSEFDTAFLTLLADVMMNPKFEAKALEEYRTNKLRDLITARSQPGTVAVEKFREVVFAGHPYGTVNPGEDTVKGYQLEDVKAYYNDFFGGARTTLYVVGKFDSAKVKAVIQKSFSGMKKGTNPERDVPKIDAKRSLSTIDRPGAPQSTIYLGMPAVSPSDADFIKFSVMNSLLGGSFASRITANIRENKGYTYSPSSTLWSRYRTGYWYEVADVTTKFTGASVKEILFEIDRLQKEPPSADELQGIKNYLIGIYVLQNSARTGVINQLENVNYNDLNRSYIDTYVQNIVAVTPKDVQEMAAKYLRQDKMTIVVVGDKSVITDQLKPYEK